MPVLSTTPDPATRTLVIVSEHAATPERLWRVWADGAQLGRWWGPPGWPATFRDHTLEPGRRVHYWMTGPGGEESHGSWCITAVDAPRSLEFDNGFADATGQPVADPPAMRCRVDLQDAAGGTRMTVTTTFPTDAAMEQLLAMGMAGGMTLALGQVDGLLAEEPSSV